MEALPTRVNCFSFPVISKLENLQPVKVKLLLYKQRTKPKARTICACRGFPLEPRKKKKYYENALQNVDMPAVQSKRKKKPFVVPVQKVIEEARKAKALAEKGIDRPLEPPKNGILVPELIPVAHTVLENWKVLIKGLTQLLTVVSVYGCSNCSEVHIGPTAHEMQDCTGPGSNARKGFHTWVKGSANDVLVPIESYHQFDPFGKRIKHETRFAYDRIPAVVELCIQGATSRLSDNRRTI